MLMPRTARQACRILPGAEQCPKFTSIIHHIKV
jgi:hypothetical protein